MTATVDGQAWSVSGSNVSAIQFPVESSGYLVTGIQTLSNGTAGLSVALDINDMAGPGTYPLGTDAVTVAGGSGSVTSPGASWTTALAGAAGTVTITVLTTTRITGTFTFTAPPATGSATGTPVVHCCWGVAGDVGTLTITSLTKTRLKGTFSATVSARPGTAATGKLVITNGTLGLGLFHSP